MEILKICGIAVLCAILGAVLGRTIGGMASAVRIAGLCAVLGGVAAIAGEISGGAYELAVLGASAEYVSVMGKALGISLAVRICSDVCRDCGEGTVASAVESAGKLTLVLLALPLLSSLAEKALGLAEVL